MSKGDLRAYYFRMINRLLDQMNVPKDNKQYLVKEVHEGLKANANVTTISKGKISREEMYKYVSQCEMILSREYGYNVDDNEELKFHQ